METTVKGTTTAEAIESFLASDMSIAVLDCKTAKAVHNEYNLFTYRIRKSYDGQLRVYQRGTSLYFERT